ncbi:MAG: S41 family peptidase [Planctomycetota bacterium]|nr:S41 family peptidase [Planctomycetota bacterium]
MLRPPSTTLLMILMLCQVSLSLASEPILWPFQPQVSPDGTRIAFTWEGSLWTASSDGGTARRLTDHPCWESLPRWSPDGQSIVFASSREGSSDLWQIPADGGRARRLTWWSGTDLPCDLSPDGSELLFSSDRIDGWKKGARLYRMAIPAAGSPPGEPTRLTLAASSNGRYSPDGTHLLTQREGTHWSRQGYRGSQSGQIWLYHLESGDWRQLTPEGTPHTSPVWIDHQRFLMVEDIDGRGQLVERDIENRNRRVWTSFEQDSVRSPSVSADGNTVIFEQGFHCWKLNRSSGQILPLELRAAEDLPDTGVEDLNFASATSAALSPDGKQVAFGCQGDLLVRRTEKGLPANRVDAHPARDDDPIWLPGGKRLLFVSRRSGTEDLYTVHSSEPGEPRLDRCLTSEVNRFPGPKVRRRSPRLSPDRKQIAFVHGDGDLAIQDLDGENFHILYKGWSPVEFRWSPDSQWIAFSALDQDFNRDVWLVRSDATMFPFNLSANPRPDLNPAWSPDGRKLCFVSQRDEEGGDLWWLWLRKKDHQQTPEDRILADDPLEKAKSAAPKKDLPKSNPPGSDERDSDERSSTARNPAAPGAGLVGDDPPDPKTPQSANDSPKQIEVQIDLDGIRTRFQRAFASDQSVGSPIWDLDSKKVFFNSSHEGSAALYALSIPQDGSAKKIAAGSSAVIEWNRKSKKMLRIVGGVPTTVTATGTSVALSFARKFPVDLRARRREVFDEAWATMRDRFYDPQLKGLDWNAIGDRYRPVAVARRDPTEFGSIINRMIGELNSSHQRFTPAKRWSKTIRATGVPGWRLEPSPPSNRYRILSILPGTPAAAEELDLQIGDELVSIDGQPIHAGDNLSIPLEGKVGSRVAMMIARADQPERRIVIRPISNNVQRSLLYKNWQRQRREQVGRLSQNRLGYLHIQGMNQSSLDRFSVQLYEAGHGKEGLIIDVRENGGGWTTDLLLAALTRTPHAYTIPRAGIRGYPNDRLVTPSWTRPIAVICNQNSFSNAEIFSHAIQNLGRGAVIGVQTAGGVISTGSTTLLDGSRIRVPFRGWYTIPGGVDMELNGAIPDVVVRSRPSDEEQQKDRQLEAAIERLLEDLPPRRKLAF